MPKTAVRLSSGTVPLALLALAMPTNPAMGQGLAVYARTPSGLPETLFDADQDGAAAQLADQCLEDGLSVTARDAAAVTCQLPDDREAVARADLGQAGRSGRPIFYRFQIEDRDAASRVLATGWEEVAGFWGGTEQRAFDDPVFHNALIDLMVQAGGRLPPGTRFPNHAMIGADFVARIRPEQSLEVTEVEPDSPAMRAGLQPGDLVTRIANRRTRTLEDLNRSLVDAARTARFEIRFLREGREGVALLRSEFRPVVTAPALAEAEEQAEPTPDLAVGRMVPAPAPPAPPIMAAAPAMVQPGAALPGTVSPQSTAMGMVPAYGWPAASAATIMASPGYPAARHYLPLSQSGTVPVATPATPAAVAPAAPAGAASPGFSVADELSKFAALLKEGHITQAEFDVQKARLLTQ